MNLILFGNVITTPPLWTEKAVTRHRLLSQPSQNSPLTTSAERRIKWTDAGLVVFVLSGPNNPTTTKKCRDDGRDWRIKPPPLDADFRYSLSFCSPPQNSPCRDCLGLPTFFLIFDIKKKKKKKKRSSVIWTETSNPRRQKPKGKENVVVGTYSVVSMDPSFISFGAADSCQWYWVASFDVSYRIYRSSVCFSTNSTQRERKRQRRKVEAVWSSGRAGLAAAAASTLFPCTFDKLSHTDRAEKRERERMMMS